jgi:hypothetical protein
MAPASIKFWTGGAVAFAGGYSQYQARLPFEVRSPLMSTVEVSQMTEKSITELRLSSDSLHTIYVLDTNTNTGQWLFSSLGEVKTRRYSNSLLLADCASRQDRVGAITICDCGLSKSTLDIREQPPCLENMACGVDEVRSGRQILGSSSRKDGHGRFHGLEVAALNVECCEACQLMISNVYL